MVGSVVVRLLGPVGLVAGADEVPTGRPKQRAVLAVLAMQPGAAVSAETLIDRVWGDDPPAAVRTSLHTYVTRLRGVLRTVEEPTGGPVGLLRVSGGYLLRVPPAAVDLHRARAGAVEARSAVAAGDDTTAVGLFDAVLAGWGRETLTGVAGDWAGRIRVGLEGERLALVGERAEAGLRLGRHRALVGELAEEVAASPTAERIAVALMVALQRTGATRAALDTFDSLRRALLDDVGVEPGAEARRVREAVLAGDDPSPPDPVVLPMPRAPSGPPARDASPGPPARDASPGPPARDASPGPPTPGELPRDIPDFTGRDDELRAIDAALAAPVGDAVPVVAIHGPGGIGKSSLAVHAAHRLRRRFPDGQLHVDLRGAQLAGPALRPGHVLGRFLRALGVPAAQEPESVEEAAARYRSELTGRRVLVVLDNAVDAAQVAPLLPGDGLAAVLVTSRRMLLSLPGVRHLGLAPLPEADAVRLLAAVAGGDRVAAEPAAAVALAHRCAYNPLALRIAAARLAARPDTSLASLAERLADSRRRLDELSIADAAVRGSIAVSHREVASGPDGADAVRLFRRLGMLDVADFGVPVAAALAADAAGGDAAGGDAAGGVAGEAPPAVAAERTLDRLVEATLVRAAAPGRYEVHDLVRLYARDEARAREPDESWRSAEQRVLLCYLDGAIRATRHIFPTEVRRVPAELPGPTAAGFVIDSEDAAAAWTDIERGSLVTVARQALDGTAATAATAVRLTAALLRPFKARGYWADIIELRRSAALVAQRLGDVAAQALAVEDVGYVELAAGRLAQGMATLHSALELHRRAGDPVGEAFCLSSIGSVHYRLGHDEDALRHLALATAVSRAAGSARGEAVSQNLLGLLHQRRGRYDEAVACHRSAVRLHESLAERRSMAVALTNLGWAYHRAGRSQLAIGYFERSLAEVRGVGRYDEAENLWGVGEALAAVGRPSEARLRWEQALDTLEEIGALPPEELARLRTEDRPSTPSIIALNT